MFTRQDRLGKSAETNSHGSNMDLKTLKDTPSWDWPEGVEKMFLGILRDDQADEFLH
jgi:hypothetical protein